MEYLIGIIGALIGLYFYQSSKRKSAEVKAIVANVKGQDIQLKREQAEIQQEINYIDNAIKNIKLQHQADLKKLEDEMSLSDRAKLARSKFGK